MTDPNSFVMLVSAEQLLAPATEFVRSQLKASGMDASHDWDHVLRVKNMAKKLAAEEGLDASTIAVIDLAATLHDVQDYKYSGSATATAVSVKAFLTEQGAPGDLVERVLSIIESVGFKDELGKQAGHTLSPEQACVQDADRLDAIGAIGIARCFTFGGRFNRKLYDPQVPPRLDLTKEQYMATKDQATTINHFPEKLLKLKGMMKTASGKRIAERRHACMVQFLEQFLEECSGRA
uniref:HD/PDEase domain-containing protein n=1 Tax=Dunaliella tertiolecta TaxID=3047 RepID=A0A7S3QVN3_DUNTE|mmetsp:Transcript_19026/g.49493  ORF Transcript_19026/g.49493 Transcript_19026/m.49493 type:complete len:236 (+) Transcript_19026:1463-2170(+)|eukprot:CAMPEP_0202348096 /NCGR_PEP_ID=MMETSP1126-20121109/6175_1 /ASSEMBLY_ACC=CAM_ASM_000457 /TAXON_ID=3047 /ORGANISM="Dunaliella tertiolecta, Strain CCMP1320" /LENGTH=235 /DNA_ID=CAMNT_0048939739 /DNA_START=153 /DNA_END=860 /DNA_ORIENTATION=+